MIGGHLWELVIVLVIALVIFGPKRLPELGSSLGKGIREFRKATNELQDSINVTHHEPLPGERPAATSYTPPQQAYAPQQQPPVERPAPTSVEYTSPSGYAAPAHPSEQEPPRA